MDAASVRRVEQQRVAMLYANRWEVSGAALIMVAIIAMVAWPSSTPLRVLTWCGFVIAIQMGLQGLAFRYRKHSIDDIDPKKWGDRFARAAIVAGLVWGSAAFVLVPTDQPLALALISACLAGRATVSTMTHAYYPLALNAFTVPIFGMLAARYMTSGDYANAALGVMWIAVLGYILLFVDKQARALTTQIRVRVENEQLVEELRKQNAIAEQARVRAEEASRSKSRFFAAANHDLRQPLHSLGLFATALRNGSEGRSGIKLVDQILQCTDSLERLFDNLLDISRLDAGQVEVKRNIVPLNDVLSRLRSMFTIPAQEKNLNLRLRPSSFSVTTDSTLLFRVLSNLVSNALRYTDNGGIVVGCRRRGQKVVIEVWDTGIGIPPEHQERIFEEFYQLNNPERDRTRGLGLGLASVRRIAQLLDHPIRLHSRVGKGSRFSIEVPIADPSRIPTASVTVEHKVPNLLGGKFIVVIDDEASVRLGMQSLLESWGCKCLTASDANEALASFNGTAPDFIIADLRLRGEDTGIDAIRILREQLGNAIPAVLVSGDTATEQLRTVSAAGLTMMHKPLKAVRLRALLNHEFAKARATAMSA
jgi:signal transduction histidine kinase/ActR/RegA family two-component response regulator